MSTPEHELIALEQEWMDAIQRKDFPALDQIVGPDYAYTASGQGRWSRQRWMETVPVYDIHTFEFLAIDVRVYGDVAVVLPHLRQMASVAGATRSGEFLLTDVWVRRDGRWQVVARSSILMPQTA
jgi:ketosteroid isomerase-like protein